jgi:hypothetical protein
MKRLRAIGYWSSMLSLLFATAYSVPQLLSEARLLPHPQDLYWLFVPSLLLAPSFLIAMICLHFKADENKKLFAAIGVAFAILYCADVTLVYFSQLTVVIPAQLENEINEKQVLLFDRRTFLMAIDCIGYFFMSLSTLFAAFAFQREHKWLFRGLLYNGLLLPVLILAFFFPVLYYIGALWMITFPLAMINAAKLFNHKAELSFKLKLIYEH